MESDLHFPRFRISLINFYPRSPHGERLAQFAAVLGGLNISIHALRMESDDEAYSKRLSKITISIHALRMESDHKQLIYKRPHLRFLSTLSAWRATSKLPSIGMT